MTTALSTWRRRCIAAEDRAFAFEAELRSTRAKFQQSINATNATMANLQKASTALRKANRILKRIAERHLGEGATASEVEALVTAWSKNDSKLEAKASSTMTTFTISSGGISFGFESPDDHDD